MIFVILFSCLSRGPDDQGLSCGPGSPSIGKACRMAASKRLKTEEKGGQGVAGALRLPATQGSGGCDFREERRVLLVTRTADVSSAWARASMGSVADAAPDDGRPRPACPR